MRRASDFGRESEFSVHVCYNVPLLLRHTVPSCRGEDAKGKDRGWYEAALHDGNPIIVYLHGSAEHRSAPLLGFFSSFKERGSGSARWGKGRRSSVFVSVLPHTSFFLLWKFEGVLAIGFSLKKSIYSVWRLMLIFNWKGDQLPKFGYWFPRSQWLLYSQRVSEMNWAHGRWEREPAWDMGKRKSKFLIDGRLTEVHGDSLI